MQISGVSLTLTWPCRLCLLRGLLCTSRCYKLSPFQAHWGRWHCTCFLRPVCLFTVHVGSGPSPLFCGVFLPPPLLQVSHSWLLVMFCCSCLLWPTLFCLFSVVFPVRCISSVSPRFYFRKHAFCFLPLAIILDSLFPNSFLIKTWFGQKKQTSLQILSLLMDSLKHWSLRKDAHTEFLLKRNWVFEYFSINFAEVTTELFVCLFVCLFTVIRSLYVIHTDLELTILLPQPPKCSDYNRLSPWPVTTGSGSHL
jgi:hypothetical protein